MSRSQKQRGETIDRTNPFGGLGRNGSSFQRKNSQSTASNVSMGSSFEISPHSLMPLLLRIKQENQQLNKDKDTIKEQMTILEGFSNNMLIENDALRLHYAQRSTDVQMLIKSLSINMNQNSAQNKHLIQTYKQNNDIMTKQIQQISSNIFHTEEVTKKMSQQLDRTTKQNSFLENDLRNRMVKNKILYQNMEKLIKIRDQNMMEQFQKQVCDLQFEINRLKKKNIITINFIRKQRNQISTQKPAIKQLALQTIKSHQRLKYEVEQLEIDYKKFCERNQELKIAQENQIKKSLEIYTQSQSRNLNLNRLTFRKKTLEGTYNETKERTQKLRSEKSKLDEKKTQFEKQINNKKKGIQNMAKQHQKNTTNIQSETKNKISQIKQKIRITGTDLTKALKKELNPQKSQIQLTIAHLQQQLESTQKQVQKIQKEVKQLNNPIRQIMRLEFQLKKNKPQRRTK